MSIHVTYFFCDHIVAQHHNLLATNCDAVVETVEQVKLSWDYHKGWFANSIKNCRQRVNELTFKKWAYNNKLTNELFSTYLSTYLQIFRNLYLQNNKYKVNNIFSVLKKLSTDIIIYHHQFIPKHKCKLAEWKFLFLLGKI